MDGLLASMRGRCVISVSEVGRGVVSKASAFRPNSMMIAVHRSASPKRLDVPSCALARGATAQPGKPAALQKCRVAS